LLLPGLNPLYAVGNKYYLPFLKQGGLFIKTEKYNKFKLGDEVFLLLTLFNGEKSPVAGKVVWINPKDSQGSRPSGIGLYHVIFSYQCSVTSYPFLINLVGNKVVG